MRIVLVLLGLVAILAGCVSGGQSSPEPSETPGSPTPTVEPLPTPSPRETPTATATAAVASASPAPSASAATTEPTPPSIPPKPTGVTFDTQHDVFYVGDVEYVEITQAVTWRAPREGGVEIRVYGVTECLARPDDPEPEASGPCLVVHTPLPESVRTLLATAPASAGSVSWSWTQETGCIVGLDNRPDGPVYHAVVLAAYGPSGHSIFAIAEPGSWWEPGPYDMVC